MSFIYNSLLTATQIFPLLDSKVLTLAGDLTISYATAKDLKIVENL
jgi:hypothetical protein